MSTNQNDVSPGHTGHPGYLILPVCVDVELQMYVSYHLFGVYVLPGISPPVVALSMAAAAAQQFSRFTSVVLIGAPNASPKICTRYNLLLHRVPIIHKLVSCVSLFLYTKYYLVLVQQTGTAYVRTYHLE